jgi:energy-coupling factor transporter ATP-binding protein EcfA2
LKAYTSTQLRNVVLAGHSGSGKTTLAEAMLFASGAINRMGRVEDRNTVSDFDEQEHAHHYSISASLLPIEWQDVRINLIDTPHPDARANVAGFIPAEPLIAVDAASVQAGTEAAERAPEGACLACSSSASTARTRTSTPSRGAAGALRRPGASRSPSAGARPERHRRLAWPVRQRRLDQASADPGAIASARYARRVRGRTDDGCSQVPRGEPIPDEGSHARSTTPSPAARLRPCCPSPARRSSARASR